MFVCLFVGLLVGFTFVGCFEVIGGFVVLRFVCVLLIIFSLVGLLICLVGGCCLCFALLCGGLVVVCVLFGLVCWLGFVFVVDCL